jgi:hypothetical protein
LCFWIAKNGHRERGEAKRPIFQYFVVNTQTLSYHLTTHLLRRHYKQFTVGALWAKAPSYSENKNKRLNTLQINT